jgi:ABC-type Zn uptake system ZnuABC Zn-binding protein ZnuA
MRCNSHLLVRALCLGLLAFLLPLTAWAKLRVVASLPLYAELVRQVGGEEVKVFSVAKELQDPHFIQPTPWIVTRLARADLFVTTGLDLELWSGPLLEAAANRRVFQNSQGYLDLSQGIQLLQIPLGKVTRQAGDVHLMGNPHYYYSPRNVGHITQTILRKLVVLKPERAEFFQANADHFIKALESARKGWEAALAPYRGAKIVPFHNAFPYFEAWSGLKIMDHIEPKPGINPSGAHLARLTIRMKREGIKVILHEPFYNRRYSLALARRTGATVVDFYSQPGKKSRGETYIEMMSGNIERLVAALKGN